MSERWPILIVGDNERERADVRRALDGASEREYDFVEAPTGATALVALETLSPACVVVDGQLPDIGVPELLVTLAERQGALPPVVVVTSTADRQLARRAIRAGAMECLGQAWMNPESLTRAVENAVERSALLRKRDRVVEQLRESDAHAKLAIEASGTGLWEWNVGTDAVTWSPECYVIFGISTQEFDGTANGFDRLLFSDDRDRVWEAVRRAVEQRTRYEAEFRIVRPGGEVRWVSNVGRAIDGDTGQVRVLGTIIDITARKAADAALRESEERFRVLVSTLPQLVWETDAHGLCTYQGPQWEQWTGTRVDSSLGLGWLENIHPADRERTAADWRAAQERGGDYEGNYRLLCADGTSRWCVAQANPLRDSSGAIVRWVGTTTDVEEMKRAERATRESQAVLQSFYDSAPMFMGIAELDGDRTVAVSGNRAIAEFLSVAPDRLPGQTARDLGTPEHVERAWVEACRRSKQTGKPARFEFEYPRTSESCWLSATVAFVGFGPTGRPQFSFVAEDVTERKWAEALVADAARYKDEFIAMLAHELRNPLAPVRTAVALLRDRGPADPLVSRCAAVIDRQAAQMARLLDDVLDLSRLSRGKLVLERGLVVLQNVIDAAVETARPHIEQQQHELLLQTPEAPIVLEADGARLTQVLSNLLNNAAKFTPPQGRITIAARLEGNDAIVVVRDTGRGIEPEEQDRIFGLFSQVGTEGRITSAGLGIGLALVRQLVEMHGGSIDVSSAGPGKGSEFTIRLPIGRMATGVRDDAAPRGSMAPVGLRVVVVDDHADASEMLATWLEGAGCEVSQVNDSVTALSEIERFRPDIALIDLGMPGMDGYELARRIRRQPWGREVTLVALTGWGREEDRSRSVLSGFEHHLLKPPDLEGLLELIRNAPRSARS